MSLISNVRLWKRDHATVKASGSFTVAEAFDVKFTLIDSKEGLFVSLPRRQYKDKTGADKWSNEVFCLNKEARDEMTAAVMKAFENPQESQPAAAAKTTTKKVPF